MSKSEKTELTDLEKSIIKIVEANYSQYYEREEAVIELIRKEARCNVSIDAVICTLCKIIKKIAQ